MTEKKKKRQREITIRLLVPEDVALEDLERYIDEAGDRAKREALEEALREKEPEKPHECRACGRRGFLRGKGRTPLCFHAVFGEMRVHQSRYRCPECGEEVYPLADGLGLVWPGPVTPGVYRLATFQGINEDYEQAARGLAENTRGQVCLTAKEVHGLTQRAGNVYAAQRDQEAAALCENPDEYRQVGRKSDGLFCVQVDGGYVPTREGQDGIEGKVAKIWWDRFRKKRKERPVITEKSYVATFQNAEQLGVLALVMSIAMGVTEATKVLLLGDGAEWIRRVIWEVFFPWATYRLDWRHLRNYVWRAVRVMWRDRERQLDYGRRWVQWLWDGYIDEFLTEARRTPMRRPEAREARDNLLKYVEDNREGMGCYHLWYEQGEIISSSVVEKAVDEVIVRRQKKRGMVWSRSGADVVAALRSLWLSGMDLWERFWRGQTLLVPQSACLPI
jgi:hypothetical protein